MFQTLSGFSKEGKREAITPGLKSWGHINTSNTSYHVGHLLSFLLHLCLFLSSFNKGPGVKLWNRTYKRIYYIAGFFFETMSNKIWDFGKHADYNQTSVAVKHDNVLFIQFKLVGKIPNICCTELTSQNVGRQKKVKKPFLKKNVFRWWYFISVCGDSTHYQLRISL